MFLVLLSEHLLRGAVFHHVVRHQLDDAVFSAVFLRSSGKQAMSVAFGHFVGKHSGFSRQRIHSWYLFWQFKSVTLTVVAVMMTTFIRSPVINSNTFRFSTALQLYSFRAVDFNFLLCFIQISCRPFAVSLIHLFSILSASIANRKACSF